MSAPLVLDAPHWPKDLYVPPDALEVLLDSFSGPLDLLLYLIKRNQMDILDIPIAEITRQYMDYIEIMQAGRMELAADYLLMAAWLAEIKSRLLLPRLLSADNEEEDPRAALMQRLQIYAEFQAAAQQLQEMPQCGRDFWPVQVDRLLDTTPNIPAISLTDLLDALCGAVAQLDLFKHHPVLQEPLSLRERMSELLSWLSQPDHQRRYCPWQQFLRSDEGRAGLVITLLALLELVRSRDLRCRQDAFFGPIYLRAG